MFSEEVLLEDDRSHRYFGFSATDVYEEFREVVQNRIKETLDEVKKILIDRGEDAEEVECEMRTLYTLALEKSKEPLTKFQAVSRDVFRIPLNLKLPDSDDEDISDEQLDKMDEEIKELDAKYLEEKRYLAVLKREKERLFQMQSVIDDVDKKLDILNQQALNKHKEKGPQELLKTLQEAVGFYLENGDTEEIAMQRYHRAAICKVD